MEHKLKHTGSQIDNAIDKVFGIDSSAEEINEAIRSVGDKVDKEEGKGLSSNDYTNEEKDKLNRKQDALTLTVKDNGNIVIGNIAGQTKEFMPATPSGDPMHYKYLKVHGLTYDESTGLWAYRASEGGLTDLTTDEVANMYIVGGTPGVQNDAWCRWGGKINNAYPARTNIWPIFYGVSQGLTSTSNFNFAFVNNHKLIVTVVTERSTLACEPKECSGMFRYSQNLVRVIGKIDLKNVTNTGQLNLHMFGFCNALEEVDIVNLKVSIHFGESPLLSKRSLLYMIQNATPTSAITITLHAEAYARLANDADIVAALAAQPNISLIKS